MPSFVKSVDQHTGKIVYFYSIAGEDPVNVARQLIANADAPFSYQGRIQGQVGNLPIENIGAMLNQGGEVAGQAMINSTSVIVRFLNPDEVTLTPADAIKATADMLIGLPGNSFDDADFDYDNPFGDSFGGYDDGGFVDPRGAAATDMANAPLYNDGTGVAGGGEQPVGIGEWILTLILLCIPIVNIVFIIIWLVSKKTKKSKKNFIIVQLIGIGLSILLVGAAVFFARDAVIAGLEKMGFPTKTQPTEQVQNASNTESTGNTGTSSNSNSVFGNGTASNTGNENAAPSSNAVNQNAAPSNGSQSNQSNVNNTFSGNAAADAIQVEATIDNLKISDVGNGNRIVIITSTMTNTGAAPVSPHDALKISGMQGNVALNWVVDGTPDYNTALINEQVPPGSAGTYQAAYYLDGSNGNAVNITIQNMKTGSLLASQTIQPS